MRVNTYKEDAKNTIFEHAGPSYNRQDKIVFFIVSPKWEGTHAGLKSPSRVQPQA